MVSHAEGWAVEITGAQEDLDDLRTQLVTPASTWVEMLDWREGPWLLLRSEAWRSLTEPGNVLAQGKRSLELINGALPMIYGNSKPIEAKGGVVFFKPNNERKRYLCASVTITIVAPSVRRELAKATPDEPTALQQWLDAAERDQAREELIVHIGRADNWFDVYKAAEIIRKLAGGHPDHKKTLGTYSGEFDRLCRTANFHRHAVSTGVSLPSHPMDLGTAKNVLMKIGPKVL